MSKNWISGAGMPACWTAGTTFSALVTVAQ
jgi:hypothetical protein